MALKNESRAEISFGKTLKRAELVLQRACFGYILSLREWLPGDRHRLVYAPAPRIRGSHRIPVSVQ